VLIPLLAFLQLGVLVKLLFSALVLVVGSSAFGLSSMHPVAFSVSTLNATLADANVQKKLYKRADGIQSVTWEITARGSAGWVIRTEHCTLETNYENRLVKPIPGHLAGGEYKVFIHSGNCK
jgi:hypothetical protein